MSTIFHFDINGTIIGFDTTDGDISVEQGVSESISRSIDINGQLLDDNTTVKSYYEYVKECNSKGYKSIVYNICNKFPQVKRIHDELVQKFENGLFMSFRHCVEHILSTNSLLVLRTFGHDGVWVTQMLTKLYNMNFIECEPEELCKQIYTDCINGKKHILVQDDYDKWNNNERQKEYGKYIQGYDEFIQYGFDDNPCMYTHGPNVTIHRINTINAAMYPDYFLQLMQ